MFTRFWIFLSLWLLLLLKTGDVTAKLPALETEFAKRPVISKTSGQLPLSFEANRGQTDKTVDFLSRGPDYKLFLTPTEAVLLLHGAKDELSAPGSQPEAKTQFKENGGAIETTILRMELVGSNLQAKAITIEPLSGKANYFRGNDPKQWHTSVPTYSRIKYANVYPGIDLIYYGNQQQLGYDFVVAPGANPNNINLKFDGAEKIELDSIGNLTLHATTGELRWRKPILYQDVNGKKKPISGRYILSGKNEVRFQVVAYDAAKSLVIEPVLEYSTYLGGTGGDDRRTITVDAEGNIYTTGTTTSVDFPLANPLKDTKTGNHDIYVAKFNANGSSLVYSTYLGGSGPNEEGRAIAVDTIGNVYVAGHTGSADFPLVNPYQADFGGHNDCFVAKLDPTASSLVYSTYLGGRQPGDLPAGIDIDTAGNAYVVGRTNSDDFPTLNALQDTLSSSSPYQVDAFITKFNPDGNAIYSTYLGTSGRDEASNIAADASGNAYIAGNSYPSFTDLPLTNLLGDATASRGLFVAKLNAQGSAWHFFTGIGLSDRYLTDIALDNSDNIYITGITESANFPTVNAFQDTLDGPNDAFVIKINSSGSKIIYSTYSGGNSEAVLKPPGR